MDMQRTIDVGLARRLGALLLDVGVLLVLLAALNLLLFKLGVLGALAGEDEPLLGGLWLRPGVIPGTLVLVVIGVLGCWRWMAGTPGALLLGVVLVRRRDGGRAGLARLVLRMLVALGTAGVSVLWSLGGRPALHDRASGVRAVVEDEGLESCAELVPDRAPDLSRDPGGAFAREISASGAGR